MVGEVDGEAFAITEPLAGSPLPVPHTGHLERELAVRLLKRYSPP